MDQTLPVSDCGGRTNVQDGLGLRIAAIFVVLSTSTFGVLFPLSAKRFPALRIPGVVFTFTKFFGSGVIISTAFIHLLGEANMQLANPCLSSVWNIDYPWSAAFSMIGVFFLFLIELFTLRFSHMSLDSPTTGHGTSIPMTARLAHFSITNRRKGGSTQTQIPEQTHSTNSKLSPQLLGFLILEFGVILHSVIIGLTLSTTDADFVILFIVISLHQFFEGLGLGSRLAILPFDRHSRWPWILASAYGLVTPIGMAIGLAIRATYSSSSTTSLLISGILDAISSGILLYTGVVELLAHEFLFSKEVREGPMRELLFAVFSLTLGISIMALLGLWA